MSRLFVGHAARGAVVLAMFVAGSAAEAQDAAEGFEYFRTTFECSSCHGNAAEGGMGPSLAGTRLTLAEVRRQVRAPSSRRMPAYDETEMSEAQLAGELADYDAAVALLEQIQAVVSNERIEAALAEYRELAAASRDGG